jgi:hypothetical protein
MNKSKLLKILSLTTVLIALITLAFSFSSAQETSRDFSQVQKLTPSITYEDFGNAVAIDGDTLLIGASTYDNGAAYIFTRINGQWMESQKLVGSENEEYFGNTVALDGDIALVGAVSSPNGENTDQGAVYVFNRINGQWIQTQRLISNNGGMSDYFGYAIVLQGDDAFVSAPYRVPHGSVYWFTLQNGSWTQKVELKPSDVQESDEVGNNLSLDDDTLIIHSASFEPFNGGTYAFVKQNNAWIEQTKFSASDPEVSFGGGIISGDMVMLRAAKLTSPMPNPRVERGIYVFKRSGNTWLEDAVLRPDEDDPYELGYQFGGNIALKGDVALISAFSTNNTTDSVFVFKKVAGVWTKESILSVNDATSDGKFGYALTLDGQTALISDPNITQASGSSGAVYVFVDPEIVLTSTPTPTQTSTTSVPPTLTPLAATPTPTNTPLPDGTVELLVNGGFEIDAEANRVPDGWTLKRTSGDNRKCNTADKPIAYEGACAFQFKGSDGERSKLQQDIDLAAHAVSVGDTLILSGQVWAKGAVDSKATLKVKYASLPTDKLTFKVTSTGKQWTAFSALQPNLSMTLAEAPTNIILQLKHESSSGKVRYDALSLVQQSTEVLALP